MKKLIIIALVLVSVSVKAQNLQLHYDFGNGRKYLTSTIEMFKPDNYGNTFFFVDFNYNAQGPQEGYWEIAREFQKWKAPIAFHVEYNGGLHADNNLALQFNNAYLLGAAYSWNAEDYSKGFTFQALYKYIQGNVSPNNFQLTGVWYLNFLNDKMTFTGFADFWRETQQSINTKYIYNAEPQLWFNINKSFAVGSEVEVDYNFASIKGLTIFPTLGVKWTMQ